MHRYEREMTRGMSDDDNFALEQNDRQPSQPQNCPRCDSHQIKFCYYNNYSLAQPRYFCKECRRYWTHGGVLRNIPVGGGCRKGNRVKAAAGSASAALAPVPPPPALPVMRVLPTVHVPQSAAPVVQNPYYQSGGGGFYSTLVSGMNHAHPTMNHQIGGGEYRSMTSNIGVLQGFTLPSYGSPQQPLYQMGNMGGSSMNMTIQPTRTVDQEWSFLNPNASSDGGVSWNINAGSSGVTDTANILTSLTFSCPSPWSDNFSRYDPPNQ